MMQLVSPPTLVSTDSSPASPFLLHVPRNRLLDRLCARHGRSLTLHLRASGSRREQVWSDGSPLSRTRAPGYRSMKATTI